jgi:hypothetical protein
MIKTILTHTVHLSPLISLTLESYYSWLQTSTWVLPQSLSMVGALRHPISATLAHPSIPLAVNPTPHEPNAISHFPGRRSKTYFSTSVWLPKRLYVEYGEIMYMRQSSYLLRRASIGLFNTSTSTLSFHLMSAVSSVGDLGGGYIKESLKRECTAAAWWQRCVLCHGLKYVLCRARGNKNDERKKRHINDNNM